MTLFARLMIAAVLACGFARASLADCPVIMLSASMSIQGSNCGPLVYNGSGAAILMLPALAWRGTIVDQGPGAVTLVGSNGAPVNGVASGVVLLVGSGGVVQGDPSAGWAYTGPTSAFSGGGQTFSGNNTFSGTNAFTGAFEVGTSPAQFILQQGKNVTTFPVPVFYPSSGTNSLLAFDTVPRGSPSDTGYGLTWADFCNTDIEATPAASVECVHLASRASTQDIASVEYSAGTIGNLRIGVMNGDTPTFTPYITIAAGGAQTPTGGTVTVAGEWNLNAVANGGAAAKYVCVDASGNMVIQSAAC